MIPVIINTDPGHDDAMAIMLAALSGRFDIRAITTVAGNSTIGNTTRNARYVLRLLGREEIPVYSGSSRPLRRKLVRAVVHGESGLEGIDPDDRPRLNGSSVRRIISIAEGSPGKVTLICLGPLTDVAKAIFASPKSMSLLKEIVIMGGAISVPGNKNRVAEFNMFVDPEAADVVFRFPVRKTLVPLDACNHVHMGLSDFQKIRGKRIRGALLRMAGPYIRNLARNEGARGALMYDPLTVYYLMNPKACSVRDYDISIETGGKLTRGMTVAEMRGAAAKKPNISVVERISPLSFKKDFINALSGCQ